MNILERILAIQAEVPYLKKDVAIQGKYPGISHDAVSSALREPMRKHGIFARVNVGEHKVERIDKVTRAHVEVTVAYMCSEKPESDDKYQTIYCTMPAIQDDYGDKAYGMAVSMAVKYCHLKTFMIETGENEESRIEIKNPYISETDKENIESRLEAMSVQSEDFIAGINKYLDEDYETLKDITKERLPMIKSMLAKKERQWTKAKEEAREQINNEDYNS